MPRLRVVLPCRRRRASVRIWSSTGRRSDAPLTPRSMYSTAGRAAAVCRGWGLVRIAELPAKTWFQE